MSELTPELQQEFQHCPIKNLNEFFIKACEKGQLEIVKYVLTSPNLNPQADIHAHNDYGFRIACSKGHLDIVRYLLTSPDVNDHANIHAMGDLGFRWACEDGHLDIVRYLLTSPELSDHADLHADEDYGFRFACDNGHLAVVEYLIQLSELTNRIHVKAKNKGFLNASYKGYLEIANYLLTSPDLVEHADIHAYHDRGFQYACEYRHFTMAVYLLTVDVGQGIDFQHTAYNLEWAIFNNHRDIVKAMITSLYKHDMIAYAERIHKIEDYCQKHDLNFHEWKKDIQTSDFSINSSVPELFL